MRRLFREWKDAARIRAALNESCHDSSSFVHRRLAYGDGRARLFQDPFDCPFQPVYGRLQLVLRGQCREAGVIRNTFLILLHVSSSGPLCRTCVSSASSRILSFPA